MAQKAFSISQTPPYTIPAELYDEAYRLYQRKYLLWKNWILEGILTLLTVDFIVTAVKDPSNGLTYFLMVLCVVLLALLIFHPLRIRRRVMDAVKEMGELPYVAALSEQEIVIQTLTEGEQGEEIPPTVLEYDEKMQEASGIISEISGRVKEVKVKYERLNRLTYKFATDYYPLSDHNEDMAMKFMAKAYSFTDKEKEYILQNYKELLSTSDE